MAAPVIPGGGWAAGGLRKVVFAALVAGTATVIALMSLRLLMANGMEVLEYPIFVLSIVLAVPIVASFWLALVGALAEWHGTELVPDGPPDVSLATRTAIVMPIHNEDPHRVCAALRATWESLVATGQARAFRLFVLSDTTDPQRWLDEEAAVGGLRATLPDADLLTYRHRAENSDQKVGNIRDFCRRWGEHFDCMIVLDADSVMSGPTLVRLAQLMQVHRGAGIMQVPPVPVNGTSVFARGQQFAASAYGSTWAAGLAWLQTSDGNYYGHNAILRIRPFVQDCELPVLPGKRPLGGAILSHDFVEAALMRRAGHTIHLLPHMAGSYEESPPTLIDHANRDRRWCQGNLQHSRVLGLPGLRAMSRIHMLMGIMAYASAPLWLLMLLLGTAHAVWSHFAPHQYFAARSLFPRFETPTELHALVLMAVILVLLFVPRSIAVASRIRTRGDRMSFGGTSRLVASFVLESVLSLLLAPILMIEHTRAVVGILGGRTTRWSAQCRDGDGVSLRDAVARYWLVTIGGVLWIALLWWTSRETLWWMLPALSGLVMAIPLTVVTGSPSAGLWLRRCGMLLSPPEVAPEPVVARFLELVHADPVQSTNRGESALERLLRDEQLRDLHEWFGREHPPRDPLEAKVIEGLVLKCKLHGAAALSDAEQRIVLGSPAALRVLAREHA